MVGDTVLCSAAETELFIYLLEFLCQMRYDG